MSDTPADNGNEGFLGILSPIPAELKYLVKPALHYGRKYRFDNDVQWFLDNAPDSDFQTLATLAERARLADDYSRFNQWVYEVDDIVDGIVDDCYPYQTEITEEQRNDYLQLINPNLPQQRRDKLVQKMAEGDDPSEAAELRREMRMRQRELAEEILHDMDIYFLFALMDACDLAIE